MRFMTAGHIDWKPKYFEQWSSAYRDASPVAAFAARRYPAPSGRPKLRSHAVRLMRRVMPGSKKGPGYGSNDCGLICSRSIWVRPYSTLRYS